MNTVIEFLQSPSGVRLLTAAIAIVVIFVLAGFIRRIIPRYVEETASRYRARKFINLVAYGIVVIAILIVYSNQLTGFTVFLGIAGAGIAFALQEVIASIAGFMVIHFSQFFKVGDRVLFGGIKGDVIDIGVFRTSLMEIGDWVDGDLYNGRIVRVANSFIFKEPVYNYSGEFPFLWDEVKVPLRVGSDIAYAKTRFLEVLEEVQGEYAKEANAKWSKMTETLMIEKARVQPMVHMGFDQNWLTFTLRYVVDFKARRATRDLISTKVLQTIEQSEGKLQLAASAIEVTNVSGTK